MSGSGVSSGTAPAPITYKVIPVKAPNENQTVAGAKGVVYLKDPSATAESAGAFHRTYAGVHIVDGRGIKFYTYNTSNEGKPEPLDTTIYTDLAAFDHANNLISSVNTSLINFVSKDTVHFPLAEPIITSLVIKNDGTIYNGQWLALNSSDYLYPADLSAATNITFRTGKTAQLTIDEVNHDVRFRVVKSEYVDEEETVPSTVNTVIQLVAKTGTALPAPFNTSPYMAVDLISPVIANNEGPQSLLLPPPPALRAIFVSCCITRKLHKHTHFVIASYNLTMRCSHT